MAAHTVTGHATFDGVALTATASFTVAAPPSGPILGMNFESQADSPAIVAANAPYEPRAHCARIYVADGQTNIHNEDQFERAYALGIRDYTFSSKDTTTTAQAQCIASIPADCRFEWINHHEPEDNIAGGDFTLAQWVSWQVAIAPIVRAHGGSPWGCLQSYTVNPRSNRNVADYKLPAGTWDGVDWDYYPDKEANPTRPAGTTIQQITLQHIRAGNTTLGLAQYGIAEYGILQGSIYNAATVAEFKSLTTDAKKLMYWSNHQAENQILTPAIADAFFGA